jgi:hypothetical protein
LKQKFENNFLEQIQNVMREMLNISADAETKFWCKLKYTTKTLEHIARLDITVQEANLFAGQLLIIEIKNQDGTWPGPTKRLTIYNKYFLCF